MKVSISADGLTVADYLRSGCDEALAACPRRYRSDYETAAAGAVEAAEVAGDLKAAAACGVVRALLSTAEPWSRATEYAEHSAYWPTYDFDDGACAYLALVIGLLDASSESSADGEVRARAADFLYQRSITEGGKRYFKAAQLAVVSYLAEASLHERGSERWYQADVRVARAFDIAAELNAPFLRTQVVGHIDAALAACDKASVPSTPPDSVVDTVPSLYGARLMKHLLNHFRKGDPVTGRAALAERLAGAALTGGRTDWDLARDLLGTAASWYLRAGDQTSEVAALDRQAELWMTEAMSMVSRDDTHAYHYAVAGYRLLNGIKALKGVRGAAKARGFADSEVLRLEERIHEVRWLHQHYQERAVKALVPIRHSGTFDAAEVLAKVEGKDTLESIFAMTRFAVPERKYVEGMVKEETEKYVLSRHFGLVQLDNRGRTTARAEPDDMHARAFQRAVQLYETCAQCHIIPLLWKISGEHAVDLSDFVAIARVSQFVPVGREMLFARGLHEGFKRNLTLALHLLIPQVENAIRLIVLSAASADIGLRTEQADQSADPELPTLPQALCEPWSSALARALGSEGADIVYALRALLIERFGGNLRNCVLHGLVSLSEEEGWSSWYLWWLILKICFCADLSAGNIGGRCFDDALGGDAATPADEEPIDRTKNT